MALLNFGRFGISDEEILKRCFNYVIGFDLGHGEISASYWNLQTNDPSPIDLYFNKNEDRKVFSALFRKKNGEFLSGRTEVLLPNTDGNLFTCFKVKPARLESGELYEATQITKKQLIQEMLLQGLLSIKKNNARDFSGKGILAIGCPSSSEWLSGGMDIAYAKILTESVKRCGLDLSVIIMPESRASLIKVYKEHYKLPDFRDKFHKGVFVEDHGSSTLDSTSIDFETNTQNDESIPLGASFIEEVMIREFCHQSKHKKTDIVDYEIAKLDLRTAKEAFYIAPGSGSKVVLEFNNDDLCMKKLTPDFMHQITHGVEVCYSTDECPVVCGTWSDLHRNFLSRCKKNWLSKVGKSEFDGLVLLTGGASRMDFVEENAKEIYPKATIVRDPEPSYCVSRGLSWATRTDLEAFCLVHTAKERIAAAINSNGNVLKSALAERLAPIVFEYVEGKISWWVDNGSSMSLDSILKKCTEEFMKDRKTQVKLAVKEVLKSYLNKTGNEGIKSIIVSTVNELFESAFPGRLSARSIDKFSIDSNEWTRVVDIVSNVDSLKFAGLLIDEIDFEDTISRALKNNFLVALALLPFYLICMFLDWAFDTELCDKMDKAFQENRYKVCSKSDREKVLANLRTKKNDNIRLIKTSLELNSISSENEKKMVNMIIENLDPVINRAVDNVSLYF